LGGKREKKCEECNEGLPLWMMTYSDMVTLLLTFFVMLLAMANFEEVGRVQAVIQSIRTALGVGGFHVDLLGVTEKSKQQPKEVQPEDNLQPIMSKLREITSKHVSNDLVKMTRQRTEIRVKLDSNVLFAAGSTNLHPAAYSLLSDVAEVLGKHPVEIVVEGHTDNTGSADRNWGVSSMRSVAVVNVLQERGGIDGASLEARGYGQFRPAEPGIENSPWNRRVELVIRTTNAVAYDAIYEVEAITGGTDGR